MCYTSGVSFIDRFWFYETVLWKIKNQELEKVPYFVLHVICVNRPKREKSSGDSRCAMLYIGKSEEKKFTPTKLLPSDQKSLTMKILRADLVSHSWINCLDCNYQSFDPLSNGWIFVDGALQSLWYKGASLPNELQIQNYLREESEVLRGILQDSEEIDELKWWRWWQSVWYWKWKWRIDVFKNF